MAAIVRLTKTIAVNVYRFPRPAPLITPYFVALVMALAFLGWGSHALVRNGISASTRGLFRTPCTTHGIEEFEVKFGEMQTKDGSRVAGLGAAEEVMP
ncbi:hypothetical protein BO99DRAFT_428356 [Aspergillus violaceofuscus CBS 115571]|uniref:Uncharacterized protein n=1 Tax=Aspergillus violaceofuscus (strain CBS 115571) TaxID=1450538 RepID=A0A2V5HK48_ASPV1|nr:hypothetical protein BO99DRAFT_428356 [Aspergillus violaceofuscus CBS 115571]